MAVQTTTTTTTNAHRHTHTDTHMFGTNRSFQSLSQSRTSVHAAPSLDMPFCVVLLKPAFLSGNIQGLRRSGREIPGTFC